MSVAAAATTPNSNRSNIGSREPANANVDSVANTAIAACNPRTKRVKPKPKKPLYVGRTTYNYELGLDPKRFDEHRGFMLCTWVSSFCVEEFERHVGKLKIGEVRKLYVRIGK